jgi:hypothetical protein
MRIPRLVYLLAAISFAFLVTSCTKINTLVDCLIEIASNTL